MEPYTLARLGAWVAVGGLTLLALLQVLLAFGLPWGRLAWRGYTGRLSRSRRLAGLLGAGLLILGSLCLLETAGLLVVLDAPRFARMGVWVLTGALVLNTITRALSSSPLQQRVMAPITLLLSLACLLVVFGT